MPALSVLMLALAATAEAPLPDEVRSFIADRELCDHFRNEPIEGDSPEQVERRRFVLDSLDIHCAGSDRRLAALKRRHADVPEVMERLARFEASIEAPCAGH